MAQQKPKKNTPWVQCETCFINITSKDTEKHATDCPPKKSTYGFIKGNTLHGTLDVKINEEIRGIANTDSLVFLSQGAIQLCDLAIGEWAVITLCDRIPPVAKIVWPTTEKTLTSVLLTKQALFLSRGEVNMEVKVESAPHDLPKAYRITAVALNVPRTYEITAELCNRLSKTYTDRIFCVGNRISVMFFGKLIKFELALICESPDSVEDQIGKMQINRTLYKTTNRTVWTVFRDLPEFRQKAQNNEISMIGGLDNEIIEIRDVLNLQRTYGLKRSRSILIYGNSGTGKTLLVKAITKESQFNLYELNSTDLYSKGNVEDNIKHIFNEAIDHPPSIIILDEVDLLCPARSQRSNESEKRITSTLLSMFDLLETTENHVFVLGITNKIDAIDSAFRRCGRFDRELEVPIPNPKNRKEILKKLIQNAQHTLTELELTELAFKTHGFVGADLNSLSSRAGLIAGKKKAEKVSFQDFKAALKYVKPSAMREVQVEVANVHWNEIAGQEKLKQILRQTVEWPLRHPQSFKRLGITPRKGVLMFGPPGCSKTMIAKALATESGLNFLSIKGPELFSKWVGESEKAVRELFRKARQVSPSIIFFDEIDALGSERTTGSSNSVQERVLAQLLTELDGVSPLGDVVILAATNRPDRIDKALLRPGRLDRIVYVPLPDPDTRKDIFELKMSKMAVYNVDLEDLIEESEGYSGAEINAVCHEAAMLALEEDIEAVCVKQRHFDRAMDLIKPRTPGSLIDLYRRYVENNM